MHKDQVTPAIDRLFRAYGAYCQAWTEDTLFQVLTALHSLDDRLRDKHGRVLFDIPEYVALKALRNYYHHRGEVEHVLRVKPVDRLVVTTDLLHVCLVSIADCRAAVQATDKKYREAAAEAIERTFKVWGEVVDINPAVFNCVVKVYETLKRLGCRGESEVFEEFERQYDWETAQEHSHYVTGAVTLPAAQVEAYVRQMQALYTAA